HLAFLARGFHGNLRHLHRRAGKRGRMPPCSFTIRSISSVPCSRSFIPWPSANAESMPLSKPPSLGMAGSALSLPQFAPPAKPFDGYCNNSLGPRRFHQDTPEKKGRPQILLDTLSRSRRRFP